MYSPHFTHERFTQIKSDKKIVPILLQGTLNTAVPLYIFGGASSLAGVVAALGLTESLGSPLPKNFEVTNKLILV